MLTDPTRVKYRNHWSPATKARHAERIEAMFPVEPPTLDTVPFCPQCSADFSGIIYAAWYQGVERIPFMCSDCAATWVQFGGRVVLRVAWSSSNTTTVVTSDSTDGALEH